MKTRLFLLMIILAVFGYTAVSQSLEPNPYYSDLEKLGLVEPGKENPDISPEVLHNIEKTLNRKNTGNAIKSNDESFIQFQETIFDFSAEDSTKVGATCPITGEFNYMSGPTGIVVDAEGKFWISMYYGKTEGFLFNDVSDMDGDGVTTDDTSYYKPVWVFNSDGSMASFSPIKLFDLPGGGTDTLHTLSPHNGRNYNLTIDNNGNILLVSWASIYRFNYQTGECLGRYIATDKSSINDVVQASDGMIYHTYVLAGARPCIILDTDLNYVGNAIDTLGYITRSMLVEDADGGGQNLYFGTTWVGWGVPKYYSSNPLFYSFDLVDTLGNYTNYSPPFTDSTYESIVMWSSCLDWAPDGNILVGCLREAWAGDLGSRWYILDKETDEIITYFGTPAPDSAAENPDIYIPGGVNGPRGGYFANDNTLYTVDFYMWTLDKWHAGYNLFASFNASPTQGYVPLTVDFTDQSYTPEAGGIVSWQWDFENDGSIDATTQNPSHTYTSPGSYSVRLIVNDGVNTDTTIREDYINVTYNPDAAISLEVEEVNSFLGDTVTVGLDVNFTPGYSYSSYEIAVSGYVNQMEYLGLDTTNTLVGAAGWYIESNEDSLLLLTAAAGAEDISGSGRLLNLIFVINEDTPSNFIPVVIDSAIFNTGTEMVQLISGGVHIYQPGSGDVDFNGNVQAYDGSLILKHLANYLTLSDAAIAMADVSQDGSISTLDASLILQYMVNLVDSLPHPVVYAAQGDITMDNVTAEHSHVTIPVYLSNGDNIYGFEGELHFDPELLSYDEINWSNKLSNFLIEVNPDSGIIYFAGASSAADGDEGIFANVTFNISGDLSAETVVYLKQFRWNEEEILPNPAQSIVSAVTGIVDSETPQQYDLTQNYPNPFNPTTTIKYGLPEKSHVTISIYDLNGRLIEKLINQNKQAGYHTIQWDASQVSSGIYLYQIQAGSFNQMRKCVVIK